MKVRQQQKLLLSGLFLGNCHLTARIGLLREVAWVYEISRGRWNENRDADYLQRRQSLGPRYTHKLVYEEEAGLPLMFGGNLWGIEVREG